MALTARQVVRVLIGDRVKYANKEHLGMGDGVTTTYITDMFPVVSDTVTIFLTGSAQVSGIATLDHDTGKVLFAAAPTNGHNVHIDYNYVALSNDEIDEIMSGVGTGKTLLVAANCCLALAADASRWFSYVMGDKEINKNDVGRKLLELAKEFENKFYTQSSYNNYGVTVATFQDLPSGTPYDGYDTGLSADTE